ncbi:sugar phosphate isomerase/epimerase family protein [Larkinella insperata]|uniref:Sugar phosphate isomerase/epimerase family protein n=1 Tax=Larkinella insperata TaxID=332158 RepID=A0ABW3Q005_9BACT|nr:TIM barrel protein [Larkinella insperata]
MKKLPLLLLLIGLIPYGMAQPGRKVRNDFFALHNAIRGDSTYKTFDQQVALVKGLGYDGLEINQLDSFEGMKAALDKHRFTGSYFYIQLDLDAPLDPRIEPDIRALKGTKTVVAPYIVSSQKRFKVPSAQADSLVMRQLRQMADWARQANVPIAIYPHLGFYVERTDHALRLAQAINQPNVGVTFNLCHWLATTPKADRSDWKQQLTALRPYLKMMTLSGANDVDASALNNGPNGVWNQYILPLGTGSFDTYELVRFAVQDLDFRGPIGVQCYAMKGDKPTNLRNAMAVWRHYKNRLENP